MKFSVVIPTRNRAGLLGQAIRSALAQRFNDFEVVVSNNASSDQTDQVVRGLAGPRLRYVQVDRALSMADHWEYALGKAVGDWVLFLCDDDVLLPDCLAYLDDLLARRGHCALVHYGHIVYVYDDGVAEGGNYLKYRHPVPQGVREVDSHEHLKRVFSSMSGDMPKFLNAAVSRELISTIRNRHGRVFHAYAPDYSSGLLLLAASGRHVVADRPLMIWGKNLRSYGSGSRVNPAHLLTFLREFEEFEGRFTHSPYPDLITVGNCIYETLYRTRDLLGDLGKPLAVDPRVFGKHLMEDVRTYIQHGHEEYRKYLVLIEHDARGGRLDSVLSALGAAGARMRKNGRKLRAAVTGRRTRSREIHGAGPEGGFGNILEAAEHYWKRQQTPNG